MLNDYTISFSLPVAEDKEKAAEILEAQVRHFVDRLREILATYKKEGVTVPTISMRGAPKPKMSDDYRPFQKALLEHHLTHFPKEQNVGSQITAIKRLYATGKSAEECISLYEKSRESYKLTTWLTVQFHLGKGEPEEKETGFERKPLNEKDMEELLKRLKN